MSDNQKFQLGGVKWLFEMEMIHDPQLINQLKLNVLGVSESIRDIEILSVHETKQMLVFVDLTWYAKTFKQARILEDVKEILIQLLPNFNFRVTADSNILELSKQRIRKALGGSYEKVSSSNSDDPGLGEQS